MSASELLDAVRHLPDQVRDIAVGAADLDGLPDREGITEVVVFGVGTGRVAGDVVAALAEFRSSVPVVATGGRCPAWVSSSTLAMAVSPSGDDSATVAAAVVAREAGARLLGVTSGGRLRADCEEAGEPVVAIDPEAGPAAGLGVAIVPVLVVLERLGLASGMSRIISAAAEQLAVARDRLDDDMGPIVRLAEALEGRLAIVAGAGAIGKHAARRWVQELDQVGGVASVRRRLPTDAADIATGRRLADVTAAGVVMIVLRHDFEPAGLDGGVELLEDAFDEVHVFRAGGDGPLAQLLDLVLTADAVAASLATRAGE